MASLKMFSVLIIVCYLFQAAQCAFLAFAPGSHRDIPPANFSLLEETESLAIASGNTTGLSLEIGRRGGRGPARTDYDCTVRLLPKRIRQQMHLHSFYQYYAHAYGVPIISSRNVDRRAIVRACYVVRFALADRKDIRDWLHDRYGRAGIIAERERTTDIPEHSYLPDWWNQRARGLGATLDKPISTGGEENILCRPTDRYYGGGRGEDIFLHEFAHAIHNLGVTGAIPNFDRRIRSLYNRRKYGSDTRWKNTYYLSTDRELFAEGVTSYFDVNTETWNGQANGIHNHVNTRKELKSYDRELYDLVREVFPCENKFLDRCSALRGKTPRPFRMNCDGKGGGVTPTISPKPKPKTTTRPTPPLPTTSQNGCVDKSVHCKTWAAKSYCTGRYNDYMKKNCRKSCDCCSPLPRKNIQNYCKNYATKQNCNKYSYVKKACKYICNSC